VESYSSGNMSLDQPNNDSNELLAITALGVLIAKTIGDDPATSRR